MFSHHWNKGDVQNTTNSTSDLMAQGKCFKLLFIIFPHYIYLLWTDIKWKQVQIRTKQPYSYHSKHNQLILRIYWWMFLVCEFFAAILKNESDSDIQFSFILFAPRHSLQPEFESFFSLCMTLGKFSYLLWAFLFLTGK